MSATPELTRRITGLASGGVLTIVPVATGVAHVSASGLYVDQDIAEEICVALKAATTTPTEGATP